MKKDSNSKKVKIPAWLARVIRDAKHTTKEDFVRAYAGSYDPEALGDFWEKHKHKLGINITSKLEQLEKIKQIYEEGKMAQDKTTNNEPKIDVNEIMSTIKEELNKNISDSISASLSTIADKISSQLSDITSQITQCIKDGSCSKEEVEQIITSKIKDINKLEDDLKTLKDTLIHSHTTPEEVLNCPTCGPQILEAAKAKLQQELKIEEQKENEPAKKEEAKEKKEEEKEEQASPLDIIFNEVNKRINEVKDEFRQELFSMKSTVEDLLSNIQSQKKEEKEEQKEEKEEAKEAVEEQTDVEAKQEETKKEESKIDTTGTGTTKSIIDSIFQK